MTNVAEAPVTVGRKPSTPYNAFGRRSTRQDPTIGEGCPCCGATVTAARPFVDLNSHSFVFRNRHTPLTPLEASVADILARRAPGVVTYDSIILHMWPNEDEPGDALRNVHVHVLRLRRRLPSYVRIMSVYTVGYRMEFDREESR